MPGGQCRDLLHIYSLHIDRYAAKTGKKKKTMNLFERIIKVIIIINHKIALRRHRLIGNGERSQGRAGTTRTQT